MKSMRTRIAAGATILGLGGLTGVALSAGHHKAPQPVATKPLVRTKVIRRTIHVTKHAKPKHPVGAAPGAVAQGSGSASATTGSSSAGSPASYEAPVTTSASGASPAPESTSAPVVTHTSGAAGGGQSAPVTTATSGAGGGGEGEHESEGGGESEGADD